VDHQPSSEAYPDFLIMDHVTASLMALFESLDGHELIIPSQHKLNPGWELREHDPSHKSIKDELTSWVERYRSPIFF
jgi:hypothetical protein